MTTESALSPWSSKWRHSSVVSDFFYYRRLRKGMTPKEAALTPKFENFSFATTKWRHQRESSVTTQTYRNRVNNLGWNPWSAAVTPSGVKPHIPSNLNPYDRRWATFIFIGGIKPTTYHRRVYKVGLSPMEAALTPKKMPTARLRSKAGSYAFDPLVSIEGVLDARVHATLVHVEQLDLDSVKR